jgi:hypothetical protein
MLSLLIGTRDGSGIGVERSALNDHFAELRICWFGLSVREFRSVGGDLKDKLGRWQSCKQALAASANL